MNGSNKLTDETPAHQAQLRLASVHKDELVIRNTLANSFHEPHFSHTMILFYSLLGIQMWTLSQFSRSVSVGTLLASMLYVVKFVQFTQNLAGT